MGWYAADDNTVRSKGTLYFVLHPHGISARPWVGLSYDGKIVTGWAAVAHARTRCPADRRHSPSSAGDVDLGI